MPKYQYSLFLSAWVIALTGCWLSSPSDHQPAMTKPADYTAVIAQQQGAIASVHPLATQAGVQVFNSGGNAIDASLAVAFALGVVDSHNSGIGGGCFILARLADGRIMAIDGREMAPAKAHRDMYIAQGEFQSHLSKTGALASGIPGSVAAYFELQKAGGKLGFKQVLAPAIALAEQGFAIDATLASRIEAKQADLSRFPSSAQIFLDSQGEPKKKGEMLVQKDLGQSYRALAEQGPHWFYQGDFARAVERWMRSNNGIISAADFAAYHTEVREPVVSEYEGLTIIGFPPPSSGGVHVAQILNMVAAEKLRQANEAGRYHMVAESMRRAFADRAHWMGDPDFVNVPKGLLDKAYANSRMRDFNPNAVSSGTQAGQPHGDDFFNKHTTHIAVADQQGNWVAITTTLNTSFGSKVVVPGTGVLLNNQMDDFVAQPGTANAFGLVGAEANSIAPGKRPLSSMSPTLVLRDDQPVMTLGAAGGPTIISQVAQLLLNRYALQLPLHEAIKRGRIHHQWQPDLLFVEATVPEPVQAALEEKGHVIKELGNFGATQVIELRDGQFFPVTEPRLIERNQ